jgi:beta-xylosidase
VKTQIASSSDFSTWNLQAGRDVLANLPSWVDTSDPRVWGPDVWQRNDGKYVLYFSAATKQDTGKHCVGAALSDTVDGSYYSMSDTPLACDLSQGGSIDASHFLDVDGKHYVMWKIDGNSLGHGGACGNTVSPIVSTPIMLQQVDGNDGITKIGDAVQILTNGQYDGPLVEAPSMMRTSGGTYVLFFSSQCYTDANYDTSYATASSVTGPYTKTQYPLFNDGFENGVQGPGGATVDPDSTHMAFHAYASGTPVGQRRAMFVATTSFKNDVVSY